MQQPILVTRDRAVVAPGQDRSQLHALLWEGIVRQNPLVREELDDLNLIDAAPDQAVDLSPVPVQVLLATRIFVLGQLCPAFLESGKLLGRLVALLDEAGLLGYGRVEGLPYAPAYGFRVSSCQVRPDPICQIRPVLNLFRQAGQEPIRQLGPSFPNQLEPLDREPIGRSRRPALQDVPNLSVIPSLLGSCHIGIEGEGGHLTQQHLLGRKEHTRRAHLARKHWGWVLPELEVMGACVCQNHVQRVPVASTASPHALDVIRLLRGNRTQKKGGQIPDVDPHLKCRGGRNQVRGPARLFLDEPGLHP